MNIQGVQVQNRVRFMTRVALLVALSIAIRRFITPPIHGLNLGGLPLVVAGFVLGPFGGACVGALSDVLGVAFSPYSYLPFYTMTAALTGAVPALVYRALGGRPEARSVERRRGASRHQPSDPSAAERPGAPGPLPEFRTVSIAIAFGQLLTKGIMIPLFEHGLTGIPTLILVLKALPIQILHVPFYAVIAVPVLRVRQLWES
ncbi:MAG: folate family ECF transporter S component [Candidatus Xenobia bacterium]